MPETTKPTLDASALLDRYLAAWNERDEARRAQLVARAFAPDARYADPLATVAGHAALVALIGAVHAQFPGFVFARTGTPDAHAHNVRFSWTLGPATGPAVAGGTDFGTVDPDGRLTHVTGFLDAAPAH
jgi:hypothetical protein